MKFNHEHNMNMIILNKPYGVENNFGNYPKIPLILTRTKDFTLWDVQVDKCNPPFHKERYGITDEKGKIVKLYSDVLYILNFLKKYGFSLSVASRITDVKGAYQLINLFNIKEYFDHLEIYPTKKTLHFNRLHEKTNINYEDMMFFDDDLRNIRDIKKLGVTCDLVEDGLKKDILEPLLSVIYMKNQHINLIPNKT